MNTTQRIFHHLRTDLHRNWQLLLLLAIGVTAFGAVDLMRHQAEPLQFSSSFLTMAVFGFGCVMALIIIHGDPATGTSPFWKTRPIRGLEIYCSKGIQILLIASLLFVGWIAAPVLTGFRGGLAWEFTKVILPLLLGVAAVATVSRNLVQALVIGGGLLAGVAAVAWIWNLATHQMPVFGKTPEMRETGMFLAALTLSIGAIGVTFYQYLSQRQFIAIGTFSIVLIGAFLVMQYSNADLLTRHLNSSQIESLGAENATVRMNPDPTTFQSGSHILHTPTKTYDFIQLSGETSVEGLPEGLFAAGILIDGEIKNPETGETLPSRSGEHRSGRNHFLARHVSGENEIFWDAPQTPMPYQHVPFLKIPKRQYPAKSKQTWQFRGTATFQLTRMVPLEPIPFGIEAPVPHPSWSAVLNSKADGTMRIEVRLSAAMWRFGKGRDSPGIACLIVNQKRNEALATRSMGGGGGASDRRRQFESHWSFQRQFWRDGERVEIDDDWLADAKVVLYVKEFLGSIQRPVTMDPLKLPESDLD